MPVIYQNVKVSQPEKHGCQSLFLPHVDTKWWKLVYFFTSPYILRVYEWQTIKFSRLKLKANVIFTGRDGKFYFNEVYHILNSCSSVYC